jgi:hypothetical protein
MFDFISSMFGVVFGRTKSPLPTLKPEPPKFTEVYPDGNGNFSGVAAETPNVQTTSKKEPTEMEKMIQQFNPRRDMIVMSYARRDKLTPGEKDWLDSLGNRVHYFAGNTLVNSAIVSCM